MKLFVVSDIHGFYDEFINALNKAGFEKDNPNHLLISLGDHFDRGPKPKEVMNYLMGLSNRIIIKGNHEDLLEECFKRNDFRGHDYKNGTVATCLAFSESIDYWKNFNLLAYVEEETKDFLDCMLNYYETENYIFVHGWIPFNYDSSLGHPYFLKAQDCSYKEDWRNANTEQWEAARWKNGIDFAEAGIIELNKTIVCGHWNCSYGYHIKENISEFGPTAKWDPYYDKGIIAIDRCTFHTGEVNIVVLEDNLL